MTKTELELMVLQQDDQIKLLQKMVYYLAKPENRSYMPQYVPSPDPYYYRPSWLLGPQCVGPNTFNDLTTSVL